MCIVAALSLPAVVLNLKGNLAAAPGCFDGEFPIAPLACVVFVSAGNIPTFGRYNETVSSFEVESITFFMGCMLAFLSTFESDG